MGVANFDVVVVGAGAAGLSAAIGLAKRDFSVLVVESGSFPGAENWSGCVYFAETLADPELLGPDGVDALGYERRLVERGIFSGNGHSFAGVTYRDPEAFRHCYTVLRPIYDHHLAQVTRRAGAAILTDTTVEGLIRERGRVIGVSTQRGPIYADLVFLAEGDASHLVTKEGYEQAARGRQQPRFLQGVKQVIEMRPGAIESIFGVEAGEGVAYEMLLRNGMRHGVEARLNMGGFLYTNRDSISLGFVLPLDHLTHGFDGDPNLLMEWLRSMPQIRRWTEGGRPGVFGAKLIRGGGYREIPQLVDHGLAIGGAASGIGVDFPYPNFTGPATGMGLLLARAALAIRREGGSFTLDELKRHYLEPLQRSHWYDDVRHLRRWPGYVEGTRFFFARQIDALQGTLYAWTRPNAGLVRRWRDWVRIMRRTVPIGTWGESLADGRAMTQALGLHRVSGYRPIWRMMLDGCVNSLRDLFGRKRPHVEATGRIQWHYSVLGGAEPVSALPAPVAGWARRIEPILSRAAREIYRNDPVPLREKLALVLRLFADQINLLDVLAAAGLAGAFAVSAGIQAAVDRVQRWLGTNPSAGSVVEQWITAAHAAADITHAHRPGPSTAAAAPAAEPDRWEDKLGRLTYRSIKLSHIQMHWPRELSDRAGVAGAGLWHVCPANVYECHRSASGDVRLVVNYENCIKCESCWRATDLVDWGRNGGQQLIYRVPSPAIERLLADQDHAMGVRPRPVKSRDWWTTSLNRLAQRVALAGGNGQFAGELGRLEILCQKIETKLRELEQAVGAEPRAIDRNRSSWIETIATYARQLVEELVQTVRAGALAGAKDTGLREVHGALVEAAESLQAKVSEVARRTYDRQFFWAVADGRQIIAHHLEGLRRIVRLMRGHFAPMPLEPPASARWLRADELPEAVAKFRGETRKRLDGAFDRLAWRSIDTGTALSDPQRAAVRDLCQAVRLAAPACPAERKVVLSELGRRVPSLAYAVASHFWARDVLHVLGGAAFEELAAKLAAGSEFAALAWDGTVELDRDDQGTRLRGQKIFVPTVLADRFVVIVEDQLVVVSRDTPGVRIEPLGTMGMRGSRPATLVFQDAPLPVLRRRIDPQQFERLWAILSSADLAAAASGMVEQLEVRALEHATSRVQFPGLFWDDEFRESIGKFGAVKKMLAQIGARRFAIETMLHQFQPTDLSDETYRHALELKVVTGDAMNGHPGSVTYNTTQIFGGTGYSEEDSLPMLYRDGSAMVALGVPAARAGAVLGQLLLRRHAELSGRGAAPAAAPRLLVGLAEPALFDETAQRKALQQELDALRRVRHEIESAVTRWQVAAATDPQAQALSELVAEGLGHCQADFVATEAIILRTHARLEAGTSAELPIELLRTWIQDVVDAVHAWVDWLGEPECHLPLPAVSPGTPRSTIHTSYQSILDTALPYDTGDYLVRQFDPAEPRYVPELVPFDPELGAYDRQLDELLRLTYKDRLFNGRSYERHVEEQHELDAEDFELFRKHGFLKMYVPRELGGMGATKAKYNLLIKNLIRNGDVGQTLTVQANSSIGTVPVLIGLSKDLPRAVRELGEVRTELARRARELDPSGLLGEARGSMSRFAGPRGSFAEYMQRVNRSIASPVARVIYFEFLERLRGVEPALERHDRAAAIESLEAAARSLRAVSSAMLDEFAAELERRREALTQFLRWNASGQMTAFALTEPSAGSDTARVATRAVLRSVEVHAQSDGSYRFVPAGGTHDRRVIDARRLEFRDDGVYYRWSDRHDPAPVMFDEYDYESDDSARPRYYMAGPVKVPFHDMAQLRDKPAVPVADGRGGTASTPGRARLYYDYWELNGAKMWLTNARMCGVMVLYAKTKYGVTSFYVDRHAEGLLVGKNEEKMGQKASVTNELGLQSVRVPRENVNGLEGRGQVNALEALNAGRSGLTTSSATSMEDLIVRAEQFVRDRWGQVTPPARSRLEEMAEIRYMSEAIACELVVRADHRDTKSFRVEPSIGKMMTSELLMRVVELCEDIYGLEGQTHLHNLEKHKRDQRIITVYEGTNDIQRTVILKDLMRDISRRADVPPALPRGGTAAADRMHTAAALLEDMKRELLGVVRVAGSAFGDEVLTNPGMQSVFFGLSDAAAWIKLADAALGRCSWTLRHLDASLDALYRDWSVRVTRRIVARLRQRVRLRLAHVQECITALRQGAYPPEVRAANLMMKEQPLEGPNREAAVSHEVTRAIQIAVLVDLDPTISPQPMLRDGLWAESHYRLHPADAAALAAARSIAASATAPARVVAVGLGPRRAARVLEEALAAGADEAVHVVTDDRPVAIEPAARALARIIDSECRAPDLIIARNQSPSAGEGLAGMLVARELGLQFVPNAAAVSVRFTDEQASALVWIDRQPPRRLSLPAAIGVVATVDAAAPSTAAFMASLDRSVKTVPWPEAVTRRFVRLAAVAGAAPGGSPRIAASSQVSPGAAADVILDALGLKTDAAGDEAPASYDSAIRTVDALPLSPPGAVLALLASDAAGRLRAADRRALRVAAAVARLKNRPLATLVFCGDDEGVQRRLAGELERAGSRTIVCASVHPAPDAHQALELWSRVLAERWSNEWQTFSAIVGGGWVESVLARFGSRHAELMLRVAAVSAGPGTFVVRGARVDGKVDAIREIPPSGDKPLWMSVSDAVECEPPGLPSSSQSDAVHWPIAVEQLPGRRELLALLAAAREEAGVVRLADADFIIDVGYGIGSSDGYDEVIRPLEQTLREIGVPHVMLGASRKVTEELKVLPATAQIGQTGQSVNPTILLAIGISGAPQHLNYIGSKATILAFNRDPEAPLMTLNLRQARPRVFPIVGDLFQTVPAFIAALREQEVESPSELRSATPV